MKRVCLIALTGLLLSTGCVRPARAEEGPAPVYCGSFTPVYFRVGAVGRPAGDRALYAMDVINKYLGGKVGKFTAKPDGKRVRLLLNNDLLAILTPEDAAAEKEKTPATLAAKWIKKLSIAFDASKAQPG